MTRKDFIIIAKAVGEINLHPSDKILVLSGLSTYFKRAYPNFNETKFTTFCQRFFRGD